MANKLLIVVLALTLTIAQGAPGNVDRMVGGRPKTCSDLKMLYKDNACCGNPTKAVEDTLKEREWISTATSIADAVRRVVVNADGTIGIADHTKWTMRGNCLHISEYRLSSRSNSWQCGEKSYHNFFRADGDQTVYDPTGEVRDSLASFANIPRSQVDDLLILSSMSDRVVTEADVDASKGKWCAMPAPPDELSNDYPVSEFWKKCAMPHAGYFNVLECDGGRGPTGKAYAVLGIAALNQGVCYPAHHHFASETYWQIGGGATWRLWPDYCLNDQVVEVEKDMANLSQFTTTNVEDGDLVYSAGDFADDPSSGGKEANVLSHVKSRPYQKCTLIETNHLNSKYLTENNPFLWRDPKTAEYMNHARTQYPMTAHEMDTTSETGTGEFALMVYFWGMSVEPALYASNKYQSAVGDWLNLTADLADGKIPDMRRSIGTCAARSAYIPTTKEYAAGTPIECPSDLAGGARPE